MTEASTSMSSEANSSESGKKETTAAYWKRQLQKHPKLLWEPGANKKLEMLWLADHPGETEVAKNIIQNLANVKSVLRNVLRAKGTGPKGKKTAPANGSAMKTHTLKPQVFEALEARIDDCLTSARETDKDGLGKVIQYLRAARNELICLQKS